VALKRVNKMTIANHDENAVLAHPSERSNPTEFEVTHGMALAGEERLTQLKRAGVDRFYAATEVYLAMRAVDPWVAQIQAHPHRATSLPSSDCAAEVGVAT
jgi:hypothetical protein